MLLWQTRWSVALTVGRSFSASSAMVNGEELAQNKRLQGSWPSLPGRHQGWAPPGRMRGPQNTHTTTTPLALRALANRLLRGPAQSAHGSTPTQRLVCCVWKPGGNAVSATPHNLRASSRTIRAWQHQPRLPWQQWCREVSPASSTGTLASAGTNTEGHERSIWPVST